MYLPVRLTEPFDPHTRGPKHSAAVCCLRHLQPNAQQLYGHKTKTAWAHVAQLTSCMEVGRTKTSVTTISAKAPTSFTAPMTTRCTRRRRETLTIPNGPTNRLKRREKRMPRYSQHRLGFSPGSPFRCALCLLSISSRGVHSRSKEQGFPARFPCQHTNTRPVRDLNPNAPQLA